MKLTQFDTETILFNLLNGTTSLTGCVWTGDDTRPVNDTGEAIVINTIDLLCDVSPQRGTSNVNIYVPDTNKKIGGVESTSANRQRLRQLNNEVLAILRAAVVPECTITPGNVSTLYEPAIGQHYVNIRVEWNICK